MAVKEIDADHEDKVLFKIKPLEKGDSGEFNPQESLALESKYQSSCFDFG